jgi:hypothetical protein
MYVVQFKKISTKWKYTIQIFFMISGKSYPENLVIIYRIVEMIWIYFFLILLY